MNVMELGAIGELVGGVAVLVTFVYLAVQVRQNTSAVAAATYDSVTNGFNQVNVMVAADNEVASFFIAG